jgi:hypothetical protein
VVQEIMVRAFAVVRDDLISEPADPCPDPPQATRTGTPQSTVEALLWCLREQGLACLAESKNRDRLARCDAAAMTEIAQRLIGLWEHDDVEKIILARRVVGGA